MSSQALIQYTHIHWPRIKCPKSHSKTITKNTFIEKKKYENNQNKFKHIDMKRIINVSIH